MARAPIRKAVIPAAGLGTRFLPATKAVPKELLPIVDTPTIQYIVAEAVAAGVRDVIIVNAKGKETIVDHFDVAKELEAHLARTGKTALRDEMRAIAKMASIVSVRQQEHSAASFQQIHQAVIESGGHYHRIATAVIGGATRKQAFGESRIQGLVDPCACDGCFVCLGHYPNRPFVGELGVR